MGYLAYDCKMPKGVKGVGLPAESGPELPFEDALQKLESVVTAMESDELPLEKLLSKYAEGTVLYQHCQKKLEEAELKIQQLEQNAAGQITAKPLIFDDKET